MTPRCRVPAFALAALVATAGLSSPSWASETACLAPTVHADSAFIVRFPELLERIQSELATRPDLDTCAHIELHHETGADTILVSVALPDGRTATRNAAQPGDVLPTLQALLLVPQPSPTLASVAPRPAPRTAARPPRLAARGPAPRDRDLASPAIEPRSFGIELSLLGGPRMGEGQLAVGLGALSLLEAHGWLLGFAGRLDRYQMPMSGDPELALELGLLAGKRLHFHSFALDLIAGPSVATKGLALSETEVAQVDPQAPRPPRMPEDPGTGPVPRLLLGAHAGFTPRAALRSFVGMQASIGPARVDENPNPESARFPTFTLGLVLGGTVGTR